MRILLLTHSFNSLAQRLFVALRERDHEVSVEFDINDRVTEEAVALFRPDVVVAPFLKRAIPEAVWRQVVCLVVHPGIKGDRGPSALDWAILEGQRQWGVTVLQANAEMDAGDIWQSLPFEMRDATKSSLYRNEVAEAAEKAVISALEDFAGGRFRPEPLDYGNPAVVGRPRPAMTQADRKIDWQTDDTATVLRKIRSGDGQPGVRDEILGLPVSLYDAHGDDRLRGPPGAFIAKRETAICRATVNGAIWIGHLRSWAGDAVALKLPATLVLGDRLAHVPTSPDHGGITWRDIWFEERDGVGILHFDFYNGAMSTRQCQRLRDAFAHARQRDVRVIVLMGGADFWSNGMHLGIIEQAASAADESWNNINAIDDLVRDIIVTTDRLTIAALQGNAGAGGVFMALACDRIIARRGIVLNPHYKAMGNLYGSEYWTYLLPIRAGACRAATITEARLPMGTAEAQRLGLIDEHLSGNGAAFRAQVLDMAAAYARDPALPALLADKAARRARDEEAKPLDDYRREELMRMHLNFYGFDPSYHVARHNFITGVPKSRTPLTIALHRRQGGAGPLPQRADTPC